MLLFKVLFVIMAFAALISDATYPPGRSREGQLLEIMIPRLSVEDFEYVPTQQGYRYSYKLADGSSHQEFGLIANPGTPNTDLPTQDRTGPRQRMNTKNRKLSPKSLQSLAG